MPGPSSPQTLTLENISFSIVLESSLAHSTLSFTHHFLENKDSKTQLINQETKETLASITLSPLGSKSPCPITQVVFYEGKGGITTIFHLENGLKVFALAGSTISFPGVHLEVFGKTLHPNPFKHRQELKRSQLQQATHQVMILGAGLATRFEPISGNNTQYAKPSVPLVGEKSVIRCIAEAVEKDNFTQFMINTFYKADSLKQGLNQFQADSKNGVQIRYIDETEPSGTAGGLRKALEVGMPEAPTLKDYFDPTKPLLVVQGDAVTDANFSDLMNAHLKNHALITIGCQLVRDEEVHQFGIVETDGSGEDGKSGTIEGFKEKPSLIEAGPHRMASTGFYIFSPQAYPLVLEAYQEKKHKMLEENPTACDVILDFAQDVFPKAFAKAKAESILHPETGKPMKLYAQMVEGYWSDIGNPIQYFETLHDIYDGKVDLTLPTPQEDYFENGVAYWPGAKEQFTPLGGQVSGNVLVAFSFH